MTHPTHTPPTPPHPTCHPIWQCVCVCVYCWLLFYLARTCHLPPLPAYLHLCPLAPLPAIGVVVVVVGRPHTHTHPPPCIVVVVGGGVVCVTPCLPLCPSLFTPHPRTLPACLPPPLLHLCPLALHPTPCLPCPLTTAHLPRTPACLACPAHPLALACLPYLPCPHLPCLTLPYFCFWDQFCCCYCC